MTGKIGEQRLWVFKREELMAGVWAKSKMPTV